MRKIDFNKAKLLAVSLLSMSILFACSQGDDFGIDPKSDADLSIKFKNIPSEYSKIGVEHNNGLEYAFNAIKNNYLAATRNGEKVECTKEALISISKQATLAFSKENNYFGGTEELSKYIVESGLGNIGAVSRSDDSKTALSKEFVSLWNDLTKALSRTKGKKPAQLKQIIDELALEAQSTLNETELIAFYGGASTMYGSFIYWTENHRKWEVAVKAPELLSRFSDDELNNVKVKNGKLIAPVESRGWWDSVTEVAGEAWDTVGDAASDWWDNGGEEVIQADADGAIDGAIMGAALGAAAGAVAGGVGAIPGAVAGAVEGAIEGAAMDSLMECIDQLF